MAGTALCALRSADVAAHPHTLTPTLTLTLSVSVSVSLSLSLSVSHSLSVSLSLTEKYNIWFGKSPEMLSLTFFMVSSIQDQQDSIRHLHLKNATCRIVV